MGIITHAQIPQPLDDQLRPIAEQFITENKLAKVKAQDILTNTKYDEVKRLLTTKWRKAEAQRLQQEEAEKDAEAKMMEYLLREELGCPILSTEQIQEQAGKVQAVIKTPNILRPFVPAEVTDLREKLGKLLCGEAAEAFENDTFAVGFRWWLWFGQQATMAWKHQSDISQEQYKVIEDRLKEVYPALFNAINEVIVAWGRNPRTDRVEWDDKKVIRQKLEVEGSKFYWLTQLPVVETAEAKAERELNEAQAKANKEEREKRFGDLQGNLKTQLMEANPELSEESASLMATKVTKKATKKYGDNELPELKVIFAEIFNGQINATNDESKMNDAKPYGKAAGMTDEEIDAAVKALCEKRADNAKKQAADVATERDNKGFGEVKPQNDHPKKQKKQDENNKKK